MADWGMGQWVEASLQEIRGSQKSLQCPPSLKDSFLRYYTLKLTKVGPGWRLGSCQRHHIRRARHRQGCGVSGHLVRWACRAASALLCGLQEGSGLHCVLASRGENQHRGCPKPHGNRKSSRALGSLGRKPGPAIYHSIPPFQTSQMLPGRAQGRTFGRREHSLRGRPEGGNEASLGCRSMASQESPWPRPCSDRLTSWSSDLRVWQDGKRAGEQLPRPGAKESSSLPWLAPSSFGEQEAPSLQDTTVIRGYLGQRVGHGRAVSQQPPQSPGSPISPAPQEA